MKTKMSWLMLIVTAWLLVLASHPLTAQTAAETPPEEQTAAPSDTAVASKILWDIDLRLTPQELNTFLKAIRQTYDDLVQEGIEPDMVIVFRGLAVNFSRQRSGSGYSRKIQQENISLVQQFQDLPGMRLEADQATMRGVPSEVRRTLPAVKEVTNVFITLIKHQAEGYHLITIN